MAGSEENTSCMFCFLRYSLDRQPAPGTEPQPEAPKKIDLSPAGRVLHMAKVSSPTSTSRLRAAGWIGAGRPHTRESRRAEPQTIEKSLNQVLRAVTVN
jgi:hypothetical protein